VFPFSLSAADKKTLSEEEKELKNREYALAFARAREEREDARKMVEMIQQRETPKRNKAAIQAGEPGTADTVLADIETKSEERRRQRQERVEDLRKHAEVEKLLKQSLTEGICQS
jgi:hypothetical protein